MPSSINRYLVTGPVILFLAVLLLNSYGRESDYLTLTYTPTVVREGEPFTVTAQLKNPKDKPQSFSLRLYVDDALVLTTVSRMDAFSTQSLTYTHVSPPVGSTMRVHSEVVNLENAERATDSIMIPPTPPEVLMSFSAFSAFATSLSSTSAMSPLTISYYKNTVGISTETGNSGLTINISLIFSVVLLSLLVFYELTDPSYGKIGRRLTLLREKYSMPIICLFLIFLGIVLTKTVSIIAG